MNESIHDEIGYWSEVKLEIIRKYAGAYSRILTAQKFIKRHIYIDAFAGSGQHLSKTSGELVEGSAAVALGVDPPFSEYHLIDLDGGKIENLRKLSIGRTSVHIYNEDCNQILIECCNSLEMSPLRTR